ncbi:MAG TPA: pilus assembly PilX N-terminal domain-containing protein [Candidatus Saccharimonadales bacterium]|nr:pilus assembly PilX N-terminal domain-containing protein [Candidatus Saccharimonadales bacterium]
MTNQTKLTKQQAGIASILVTMILMIVISLVTIGFAKLVRREQRQSLDTQLSTQAFYAAETGINDAIDAIKNQNYQNEKTDCGPESSGPLSGTSNILDAAKSVEYSCLLIDPSPTSLDYDNISTDKSTVIPIIPQSGSINKITLSWQDTTGGTNVNCTYTPGQFPPANSWPADCDAGMLRIDLVPLGSGLTRSNLVGNTLTAFLQPYNSGSVGTVTFVTPTNQGDIVGTKCDTGNTPKLCSVTIQGPLGAALGQNFYLRVRSIYKPNSLNVIATDNGNDQLELTGVQAVIDSTGKASDVLRRIVAKIPLNNLSDGDVPEFAIMSGESICKRMSVTPNIAPDVSNPTNDPACNLDFLN